MNSGFASEAEMMPGVISIASRLWPNADDAWLLLNEHSVYSHIPDLVAARVDIDVLRQRIAGQWTRGLNQRELTAMRVLRPDRGARAEVVAARMRVRVEQARKVLRGLVRDGYVEQTDSGSFARVAPIRPALSRVVSFEAKRGDARSALRQARTHTMFADAAFVVCDSAYAGRFLRHADAYGRERVGLISLELDGRFELLLRARRSPLRDTVLRALGTERALARMFDYRESATSERRLPTASALGGFRTAPVLTGVRAREIQALIGSSSQAGSTRLAVV